MTLVALAAGGCDSILGIQEKDYDPDASSAGDESQASGDATGGEQHTPEASDADAPGPEDAGGDSTPSPEGAADATFPSCDADGSAGAVCGAITYGTWSTCSYAATCDESGSRTRPVMTPTCSAGTCSVVTTTGTDTTGCARTTDGASCGSQSTCSGGTCHCTPSCGGKSCGSDGCGASCGSCGGGQVCTGSSCCTPTSGCESGASVPGVCASDDGCGGPCTCNTQNDESCVSGACCYNSGHYCDSNSLCCSGHCDLAQSLCD